MLGAPPAPVVVPEEESTTTLPPQATKRSGRSVKRSKARFIMRPWYKLGGVK
jgi:hypothetical protein